MQKLVTVQDGPEVLVVANEVADGEDELRLEEISEELLPQFAVLMQLYKPDPS